MSSVIGCAWGRGLGGKEPLNAWLIAHARRADSSGVAHVYVWTPLGEQKVSAFVAICPTEAVRTDVGVSGSMAGGYSRMPGYMIARLAMDTSLRGQGYGEQLLLDALGKAVAASEIGGGRLIVVDAVDDAAQSFCEHYHFVPVKNREHRLVMKVSQRRKRSGNAGRRKPFRRRICCTTELTVSGLRSFPGELDTPRADYVRCVVFFG